MKKNLFKEIVCFVVVAVMTMTVLFGCGKTSTNPPADSTDKIDTSKEVKLKMYLVGDGAPDVPVVYEEVNKLLKTKINATIEPTFISWAEVQTKYPIITASGEDYDLIFSAAWIKFSEYARNGAYKEITDDMLKKYAPQTLANTPKTMIDGCRLQENNKLFMLGMNSKEFVTHCYIVRGDLMKKYGISDIKNLNDFVKYLDAVKAEPGIVPIDLAGQNNDLMTYSYRFENELAYGVSGTVPGTAVYKLGTTKIMTNEEQNAMSAPYYEKMIEYANKGYWTQNAPMSKTTTKDSFKSGKSAASIDNLGNAPSLYNSVMSAHPDWDVKVYPLTPAGKATRVNPYTQNGMSIGAFSKNPERALMALDLLRNDRQLNMTTTYGIEGKYWKENNGLIDLIGDQKLKDGYPVDRACPWGWRNDKYYLPISGGIPNMVDLKKHFETNFKEDPLLNFVFDPKPVQELHDKLSTFKDQRTSLLSYGLVSKEDIKKIQDEGLAELKKLGLENYQKEVQRQVDEFMKSKK